MTDTTVVVENDGENESADTATVLDAVDAHVSAGDAEDSAEDAEASAESADEASLVAWVAAESAWQAEQESANNAAVTQVQIEELRGVAADLVTATSNMLQAAQLSRGQQMDQLPEPQLEPETEPDTAGGSWYTKKLWGGKQ